MGYLVQILFGLSFSGYLFKLHLDPSYYFLVNLKGSIKKFS